VHELSDIPNTSKIGVLWAALRCLNSGRRLPAKGPPHARQQAINQDDAVDEEGHADILPGGCTKHGDEVEHEIEGGDNHQEEPCGWLNPPEHLHQPDVHPDHQPPHQGIKEVERSEGNGADKEGKDPQELERIDGRQDSSDTSQDRENSDSYGTLVRDMTPFDS